MNGQQKRAWFVVAVFGLTCVGVVVWGLAAGFGHAWAAFGLFGLAGFSALIRDREPPDERDATISRRAALAAGMISYATFITGCMGTWFAASVWHGWQQVSVHVLSAITVAGGIAFFLSHSIAVLVLYRRRLEPGDA